VPVGGATIELVRGRLDPGRSEELVRFLRAHGELGEAEERLADVVHTALDADGRVVAVDCVREGTPRPPGKPLWVQETFVDGAGELQEQIFLATFETLQSEFDPGEPTGPIGVCRLVTDPDELTRRPEAIWPAEGMIYAGYTGAREQVRVRWFWDAPAEPGVPNSLTNDEALAIDWSTDARYRVEPYSGDTETARQILAMWAREGAVTPEAEARRRVHEALNVVFERDEGVVAVSTAYLQRNPQLDMNLWYFRTFVSASHRDTHVATQLTFHNRDLLERRFVEGEDRRASGVAFELENPGIRKYMNGAIWQPVDFLYVGDDERGVPVRVHYFPGARTPEPPSLTL
jgi:hypothetical protein